MFFIKSCPFSQIAPACVQNRSAPAQNSLSALKCTVACRNVLCFSLSSCTQIHCCFQKCPVFQFKFLHSNTLLLCRNVLCFSLSSCTQIHCCFAEMSCVSV